MAIFTTNVSKINDNIRFLRQHEHDFRKRNKTETRHQKHTPRHHIPRHTTPFHHPQITTQSGSIDSAALSSIFVTIFTICTTALGIFAAYRKRRQNIDQSNNDVMARVDDFVMASSEVLAPPTELQNVKVEGRVRDKEISYV